VFCTKHFCFVLYFVVCIDVRAVCGATLCQTDEIVLCADRRIRVYDTSRDGFNEMCCIQAQDVGWSILDLALRCLSVRPSVCLCAWCLFVLVFQRSVYTLNCNVGKIAGFIIPRR